MRKNDEIIIFSALIILTFFALFFVRSLQIYKNYQQQEAARQIYSIKEKLDQLRKNSLE